jgi:hypothetical protein
VKTFLANLCMVAAMWLVSGWTLMLGVGVIHRVWLNSLPTIGFWPALLVASVLAMRALIAIPMKAIFEAVQDEK